MILLCSILLLTMLVVILSLIERQAYKTAFTPFNILAWPFTVILILAYCFGERLGFYPVHINAVLIWIVGLSVFWFTGLLIRFMMRRAPGVTKQCHSKAFDAQRVAKIIGVGCIIILLSGIRDAASHPLGWAEIGTQEFNAEYVGGLRGHVMTLGNAAFILLIGTMTFEKRKKRRGAFALLIAASLLVMFLFYPVKSWIMLPVAAGLILRALSGRRHTGVWMGVCTLSMTVAFFVSYLMRFASRNIQSVYDYRTYEFIGRHVLSYFFSGVVGLSLSADNEISGVYRDPSAVYTSVMNIGHLLTRQDLVSAVRPRYLVIDLYGTNSNVLSMFGTVLYYLGAWEAALYTVALGLVIYVFYGFAFRHQNVLYQAALAFALTPLAFGWFDLWYGTLPLLEIPAYCWLIGKVWPRLQKTAGVTGASTNYADGQQPGRSNTRVYEWRRELTLTSRATRESVARRPS